MIILVINCGSSSIKYQLLDMKGDDVFDLLAKGLVEKIGLPDGCLKHKPSGKADFTKTLPIPDHKVGMKLVLDALVDPEHGVLGSFEDIEAVGHRIVQGADFFSGSTLVNDDVLKKIEICCDFAPLHNPAHLLGIHAISNVLPDVPQVVTFDTAFHQTMQPYAYMYALPYEYYTKYRVRRYGAHGTSHQYVSRRGAAVAGLDLGNSKIITCHLGNGSSITAVENGKCVDTSMGITPLEGVVMGTRCGSCDPAVVQFIANNAHMTVDEVLTMMNKKSGLLGISGLSSDMRDIDKAADEGHERAALARDMLVYGIKKYIGSYAAAMGGVDIIAFTAGIGENGPELREAVMKDMEFLGCKLDLEKNKVRGKETVVSTPDSKVTICVIPTNEEIMIARDTLELVSR